MSRLKRLVSFRVSPIFGRMVPFKVGLALVLAWGATNALASPPPITPRDVDFTGNHPMRNVEGMFPDPEVTWTSGGSYSAPAISIDIMGDLSVKFQHFNDSEKLGNATFQLNFAELEMPNGTTTQLLVNGQSSASGPVSIPAYGTFWSPTFQISGWDEWIHAGTLRVGYLVDTSGIPGLVGIGVTREWRFIINLEPPIGHMNPVWHELLEESTVYAWGQSTPLLSATSLTSGLFGSGRFTYVDFPYKSEWTLVDASESFYFALTQFILSGWSGMGNCHDVAIYLSLLFESQGLENHPIQRNCDRNSMFYEGPNFFVTNFTCPIGNSPHLGSSYTTVYWSNHCVVKYQDKIFDSCLALQLSPDLNPYFDAPKDWTPSDHWFKNHGLVFTGISKRYLTTAEYLGGYIDQTLAHHPTKVRDQDISIGGLIQ